MATKISVQNMTSDQAMFGASLERAMRDKPKETTDLFVVLFSKMLSRVGVPTPWDLPGDATPEDSQDMLEEIRDVVDGILRFDPTWTIEDVALMFRMASKGKLAKFYGRVGEAWVDECVRMYAELKVDARERMAEKHKLQSELERRRAMDPQFNGPLNQRVHTTAEFIGGKNKLSAMDRAEMAMRDKERNNKKSEQ